MDIEMENHLAVARLKKGHLHLNQEHARACGIVLISAKEILTNQEEIENQMDLLYSVCTHYSEGRRISFFARPIVKRT